MDTQGFNRKLTAILSADVKGYSLLMRDNEEETVRTITAFREVIGSIVRKHRGEVVDSPGDNIMAEFASVVDAVRSAVEIQKELKVRNAELAENRRMEFRIGINLGDVIYDGDRIYGDGVNVAERMESLAETCGGEAEARKEATEVLRINPKFTVESFMKKTPYKNPSDRDRVVQGLRKAGLK